MSRRHIKSTTLISLTTFENTCENSDPEPFPIALGKKEVQINAARLVYEQVLYKHTIWLKVKNDAIKLFFL